MEGQTIPILPFNIHEDPNSLGARWEKWINRFENYLVAADVNNPERQRAMLLHYAGEQVHELFLNLPDDPPNPTDPQPSSYVVAKRKLAKYFLPQVNKEFEIFNFRQAQQEETETIDQFYARLLKLSKTCSFASTTDEIKSQIILNTRYTELRRYGLTEQPNLEDLLTRGRTLETTRSQLDRIENTATSTRECNKIHQQTNKQSQNYGFKPRQQDQHWKNKRPVTNGNICKNCGGPWHNEGKKNVSSN